MKINSMALAWGAVIIFLFLLIDTEGKKEPIQGCEETDTIKTTSAYSFTYCKDNDKVFDTRDSTWIQPSKYQKRWIETKKIN